MDIENKEVLEEETQPAVEQQEQKPLFEPRPLFDLCKGDGVFAVGAVIISVLTFVMGVFGGFALGYAITSVLMSLLLIGYFIKGATIRFSSVLCGILSLSCSAVFICTSNTSVRAFTVITGILLLLVSLHGFVNGVPRGNRETVGVFYSAASTLANMEIALKSLFLNLGKKKALGKVLIGLLCSIPVLFLVVPLLISSDYAFKGMMNNIFGDAISTIIKSLFGIGFSIFVISYGFSQRAGRINKVKESGFKGLESIYVISFLSAISACYLLYLFSQLAYFFSAFKGFLPDENITYAAYARKGFFEMCMIAVINLVLVFAALLIARKNENGKVSYGVKALATFIAVFTLMIISTAVSKMVLYINTYGMTILRLTTSAFMAFLAIVFISVILKIYIKRINVVKTALITAGCILIALGTLNVNTVCAKYNYESYKSGKLEMVDVQALYYLGDEGIPYIIELTNDENEEVANKAKGYLRNAYVYKYFEDVESYIEYTPEEMRAKQKYKDIGQQSIPRAGAYKELYKYIEQNPQFLKEQSEIVY